tara:strand:- start:425 stop:922 length:498 start_codon:yes stop_codon:yes gene_type:complete
MVEYSIEHMRKEAEEVRRGLEESCAGFPFLMADQAAIRMHDEMYCLIAAAEYVGPVSDKFRERLESSSHSQLLHLVNGFTHNFGYHPEAHLYLDLTADQFHPDNHAVMIMPEDDSRIVFSENEIDEGSLYLVRDVYSKHQRTERKLHISSLLPERFKQAQLAKSA